MPPRKSARSRGGAPTPLAAAAAATVTTKAGGRATTGSRRIPEEKVVEKEVDKVDDEEDAVEEEHSAEESSPSKNVRRSLRAPRNTQDAPTTSLKAERVTRSRTRKSRNESPDRSPTIDDDDDEDEYDDKESKDDDSDEEVVLSKKRSAASKRGVKKSPAKKRGRRTSGRRTSTSSPKRKGRGGRRPRKPDTDEEESDESELDLGESEEEDKPDDDERDDDDDEVYTAKIRGPSVAPGSRRSSRNTGAGSRVASVVLERMEDSAPSGRPTRSKSSVSQKKKCAPDTDEKMDDDDDESEKPARNKPKGATGKQQQQSRRRGRVQQGTGRSRKAKAETEKIEDDEDEEIEDKKVADDKSVAKKGVAQQDKLSKKADSEQQVDSDDMSADDEEDEDSKMDVVDKPASEDSKLKDAKRKIELSEGDLPPAKKSKSMEDDANGADESLDGAPDEKDSNDDVDSKTCKVLNGAELASKKPELGSNNDGPKVNGEGEVGNTDVATEVISATIGAKVLRRTVSSTLKSTSVIDSSASTLGFSLVSYNLNNNSDWAKRHGDLLEEVTHLTPSILCLQGVDETYFKSSLDSALKSDGYMGLYKVGKQQSAERGLATFYLLSHFEIVNHAEFEARELLGKVVDASDLPDSEKEAVSVIVARIVAPILITKLRAVSSGKCVTVANVELPLPTSSSSSDTDDSMLVLQAAAVLREVIDVAAGESHIVCGTLGRLDDGSAIRQLLQSGRVDADTLETLKKKANAVVQTSAGDEQKTASLLALLENSFRNASPNLKSSYESVLGHELKRPGDKSPKNTVWISANSLHTKSVLDLAFPSTTADDVHISLKADLSFVH